MWKVGSSFSRSRKTGLTTNSLCTTKVRNFASFRCLWKWLVCGSGPFIIHYIISIIIGWTAIEFCSWSIRAPGLLTFTSTTAVNHQCSSFEPFFSPAVGEVAANACQTCHRGGDREREDFAKRVYVWWYKGEETHLIIWLSPPRSPWKVFLYNIRYWLFKFERHWEYYISIKSTIVSTWNKQTDQRSCGSLLVS